MASGKLATHGTFLRHRIAATRKRVHVGWRSLRRTRDADDGADASSADRICNAGCLGIHGDRWGAGGAALRLLGG